MAADPPERSFPTAFVGIPTKDRPHFVCEAIQSVLAQTYPRVRVVVSDNQSAPAAAAEVARYVRETGDPRVGYHLQPEDRGEYGQGRFLIDQCREEYFVILHDDDRLDPEHIACAVNVMEADRQLAFFSTRQRVIDEQGRELPGRTQEYDRREGREGLSEGRIDNVLALFMRHGGIFSISGTVFRSAAVRAAGLVDADCEGLYPFEYNVFLRQAERGASAYYSTRPLVAYRQHAGTMRNYARPFFNRRMMQTLIQILERRRFSGEAERLRRRISAAVSP